MNVSQQCFGVENISLETVTFLFPSVHKTQKVFLLCILPDGTDHNGLANKLIGGHVRNIF